MTTPTPPTPPRPDAASAPAQAVDLALALDKFVPMELGQKHMDLRYAECVRLQDVLDMCRELDDRRASPPHRRRDEGAVSKAIRRMDECRAGCDIGEPFYADVAAWETIRAVLIGTHDRFCVTEAMANAAHHAYLTTLAQCGYSMLVETLEPMYAALEAADRARPGADE